MQALDTVSMAELQLATRNHGMPLEALRYPVTPVGLHYLLIHYDIPHIDLSTWRLEVGGAVGQPLQLSLDELRNMPATTRAVTMECAGNGRALLEPRPVSQPWLLEAVGTGEWTGVPLALVLHAAGLDDNTVEVMFTGADRGIEGGTEQAYQRSLPVRDAATAGALLAYELNGVPLPPQHGFPIRLVVPGWYGMTNVKWLTSITALTEPFAGYQQTTAYRVRDFEHEPGTAVAEMAPRALMVPPGIPDFFTRVRVLQPGPCQIEGRAWSGTGPVSMVEVSSDGGASWAAAHLEEPSEFGTWQGWRFTFVAEPGEHELACRSTDRSDNTQPTDPPWNVGGYCNNAIQRITVHVPHH